jgi:HEAT repeat protein
MRHRSPEFIKTVIRLNKSGFPIGLGLRGLVGDKKVEWSVRAQAARLFAKVHDREASSILLRLFFAEEDQMELLNTALLMGHLDDIRTVGPLIQAIEDGNPHRRRAATQALGWINDPYARAVPGLARVLTDLSQPGDMRAGAANSLAYLHSLKILPDLISMLSDSNVEIRFWCVYAIRLIKLVVRQS